MELKGNETVLEIAAETCAFGRMIAPTVQNIVELDITWEMLNAGKSSSKKTSIDNVFMSSGTQKTFHMTMILLMQL